MQRQSLPAVYSQDERRLIILLLKIITESDESLSSNMHKDKVMLSDSEIDELIKLLTEITNNKDFLVASQFIKILLDDNQSARQIYLQQRTRKGRPDRVQSTLKWHNFMIRVGLMRPYARASYRKSLEWDRFIAMERRALSSVGMTARLIRRGLAQFEVYKDTILDIGSKMVNRAVIVPLTVAQEFLKKIKMLRGSLRREISSRQVMGFFVLIVNIGFLFTTVDWSVAGTLSAIGGALINTSMSS